MLRHAASITRRRLPRWGRIWLNCLLITALMVVQIAGLNHLIDHGARAPSASSQTASQSLSDWTVDVAHSCVLYDAAAHCAGMPSALPAAVPETPAKYELFALVPMAQPDLPTRRLFLSRAPPAIAIVS
jgi:hypothetical protein